MLSKMTDKHNFDRSGSVYFFDLPDQFQAYVHCLMFITHILNKNC